jgi:glycosyltransferase involved in cell wall biosynthesis
LTSNLHRQGYRQRVHVYLDFLQENGISCEVSSLPSSPIKRWRLFARSRFYDVVWLIKKQLTWADAHFLRHFAQRILYSYDDAVMLDEQDLLGRKRSCWFRWLRSVQTADFVLTGSSYLAELARPYHPQVFVLPIGLRMSDYQFKNWEQSDGFVHLVWIGSQSTLRYLEEIRSVLEQIGRKYPQVRLRIIGDDFLDLQNMPVDKIRWSLEARREGLATSDIGLAPLPDTPFTRGKCSFKVLEYSASGLPVIGSPVGTNSQYILHGVSGYLVETKEEWLARIEELIANRDLCRRMGQAGRKHAETFDISVVGMRLRDYLLEIASQKRV